MKINNDMHFEFHKIPAAFKEFKRLIFHGTNKTSKELASFFESKNLTARY